VVSVTALRDDARPSLATCSSAPTTRRAKRVPTQRLGCAKAELVAAAAESRQPAKSDFLSSMSHELRSPLNAILGFAQLMESGTPPPTPRKKRSIDQILQAGWYLLELINEMLDLALIESGRVSLSREPVSLAEVLAECQAMIEPQAHKRGIAMTFPLDAPLVCEWPTARAQAGADQPAVQRHQVQPRRRPHRHVFSAPAPACSVRISVQDTGEGLAPDKLAQLFQPFNRLGKEQAPKRAPASAWWCASGWSN
jgi:signal transduction histidine kinase